MTIAIRCGIKPTVFLNPSCTALNQSLPKRNEHCCQTSQRYPHEFFAAWTTGLFKVLCTTMCYFLSGPDIPLLELFKLDAVLLKYNLTSSSQADATVVTTIYNHQPPTDLTLQILQPIKLFARRLSDRFH